MTIIEQRKKQKYKHNRFYVQVRDNRYLANFGPKVLVTTTDHVTRHNIDDILRLNGYTYKDDWISGHNIRGVIVDYEKTYLPEYLAIDNAACYDKPKWCPIHLVFPINQQRLFKALRQAASPAGREISSKFLYYYENPFETDKTA